MKLIHKLNCLNQIFLPKSFLEVLVIVHMIKILMGIDKRTFRYF